MGKLLIEDLQLKGKRVVMRVDFNVPVKDGKVENDKRLRAGGRWKRGAREHHGGR